VDERTRFAADITRRVAIIEGQLKGIERLLQTGDVAQAITQSAAARNAVESMLKVVLQASIAGRFAMMPTESPEDAFKHGLERAMTQWHSPGEAPRLPAVAPDETSSTAVRRCLVAVQDRLRNVGFVLEGDNYLRALPELGCMVCEIDEAMNMMLCAFIKSRMAGKRGARKARDVFEQSVTAALKFWRVPDPQSARAAPTQVGRKILAVDDDPDVVRYLTHVLERHGYGVTSASNAEEAMRQAEAHKPDLIVLDIMMPKGTEGFHFVWNLRSRPEPELRNIPIVVLTAIHDTTSLRFYPEQTDGYHGPGEFLPVEAFLDKPVQEEELLQHVERLLRRGGRGTSTD
jgi:CheY-like chemotaxis protein/DNA-binding FrmR family transcriptional regulator